uniref:Akirin n=1 Tax=Dermanyssus gallinae TaxID=34641 RepID=A0A5J6NXG0_9ACAR|nr:akirin [Dermanyssus gallinae]
MACATLKRHLEWDPLSGGPHVMSPRPAKRARRLMAGSPFATSLASRHQQHLQQQQLQQLHQQQQYLGRDSSAFSDAAPKLTSELIATSVCNEVRRLQKRKQLPLGVWTLPGGSQGCLGASPPSSPDGSETSRSPGRNNGSPSVSANSNGSASSGVDAVSSTAIGSNSSSSSPLFTFKQVNLICERMLREREDELRQHYDRVLNDKLAEQYDAFVRFTQDQIHRRFADDRAGAPSYCS